MCIINSKSAGNDQSRGFLSPETKHWLKVGIGLDTTIQFYGCQSVE